MSEANNNNAFEMQNILDKNKIAAKAAYKNISLLGKFDGEAIIQAVVLSELLGTPKAKRRKRGHSRYENTNCR